MPLARLMMGTRLSLQPENYVLLVLIALITSWLCAAFGMVMGPIVEPQQIWLMLNVLLGPMIFRDVLTTPGRLCE